MWSSVKNLLICKNNHDSSNLISITLKQITKTSHPFHLDLSSHPLCYCWIRAKALSIPTYNQYYVTFSCIHHSRMLIFNIIPYDTLWIIFRYEDPINPDFESTSAMYERVIDRAMKEATVRKFGNVNVMAATHNEDTVRFCVQRYACAVHKTYSSALISAILASWGSHF